jgi:hypothetical protein
VRSPSREPTVTVCRDCCCGSTRKHPGVDHDAHLEALRGGIAGYGRIVVSQCLLACDRSNVMVVTPAPALRRAGAGSVWLAEVLTTAHIHAVVAWIRAGGPGAAPIPAELAALRSDRPALLPAGSCGID